LCSKAKHDSNIANLNIREIQINDTIANPVVDLLRDSQWERAKTTDVTGHGDSIITAIALALDDVQRLSLLERCEE
jgi:hypothetical protein